MSESNEDSQNTGQDVSRLLARIRDGESAAADKLFRTIHDNLRDLAGGLLRRESPHDSLDVSALVNEACLRLLQQETAKKAENRRHLFGAATRAMQQVLTDHARTRNAQKRGGGMNRQALDVVLDRFEAKHRVQFDDLDEALDRLKQESPRQHEILTLRFFAGLTISGAASLLSCSESTIESDWRLARAKLHSWLRQNEND